MHFTADGFEQHTTARPPARRWRRWLGVLVIVLLALTYELDARTGSSPFQHLYYVPIVIAGVSLAPYGGVGAALVAVVLYHIANPGLLLFAYRESDIVQDDLTDLYNLRGFEARLAPAIASARHAHTCLSMLVLDVDRLKALNDRYGHRAGGDAVRTVGRLIARSLPDSAFACRFGGDEFVVALPGCAANSATAIANALREAVHDASPTLAGIAFPRHTLSISIGVAFLSDVDSATGDDATGEALFRTADAALYAAKTAGRNQIRLASARGGVRGNSPYGEFPARAR